MKAKLIKLGKEDVLDIVRLGSLIDRTFIGEYSCYQWYSWMDDGTQVWGLKENNHLVAIGSLSFYNDAHDQTDYSKATVAVLTNGQVHPDYRGRGYQRALIKERIIFSLRNRIYDIHSLVKNANGPAIKNLMKMNFVNKGQYSREMPSVIRFVYHNRLLIFIFKILNFLNL